VVAPPKDRTGDGVARFFHEIARALDTVDAILIVGPAATKLELVRYLFKHEPGIEPKVVGIETVEHPADQKIVGYARSYFAPKVRQIDAAGRRLPDRS
jgi:hypothetical protein